MKNKYTRRDFIKNVSMGVITASPAVSALAACESNSKKDKLGIALAGLGSYSTYQLGPALLETKNCYLSGIVTGTPAKEKSWSDKYNIPQKNIYNYQNFD